MSEGTTDKFVVLSDHSGATNWAEDLDEEERDKKEKQPVKTAWGNVANHTESPKLQDIFVEEAKKAEEAKLKAPKGVYRPPKPGAGAGPRPADNKYNEGGQNYQRERVAQPLPTEPPFTAFVGNLAFGVTEQMLYEFFEELGILSIKIIEDNGTPKGYAYMEFSNQEGLRKALMATGSDFQGRALNMDIAKPARSTSRYENRENVRYEGNTGGGRYDTSWGPSANRPQTFSSYNNNNRYNSRQPPASSTTSFTNRPPTERPKFNNPSGPRAPSIQSTELHETISKPKGSFENPFGNNQTLDTKKMNELAQFRLQKELERENREKEKKEETIRNQTQPRPPPREIESKTASSWRNNPKPPVNIVAPRREDSKPKKQLIKDEDGFYSKGYVRTVGGPNKEITREPTQSHEVEQRSNPVKSKKTANINNINDSNIFASLTELGDDSDANV